ncbi:MAG: DNA polymerase III subunit gamma/tau [Candidatus Adiutrix sp.]|nr:DNA polymerase III subunit gamma/tau [Candidatus Adiutrix sp.]
MSYLVLARKYRPQTFADLVGQEQVSRTLKNALATGRVAHAYLFSGPRGVGKTTAARLLAMSLSCLAENVGDRPCGVCENCLEIQSGQAVDVIEVDGASNRGINEIRDLRETVKYLPAKGRYKVYIIDEVHALTKDAFGALLKTLEEPPPHVVFIFATTETHKVLPTILSRCQRYDFRRIRVEDIAARLAKVAEMESIEAEPEALELIARQAEGGLRDSLSLMDQAIAAGGGSLTAEDVRRSLGLIDQSLVRSLVTGALEGRAAEALSVLDEAYVRGYDFKDLGTKILEYARGLTLIKVDRKNAALMNITETEEADFSAIAAKHSLETLHRHFDAWLKFQRELNYSPQPRWQLEAQVVRLSHLAPLVPVSELVERLGKLLAQNPPPRPVAVAAPASAAAAPPPRPAYQQSAPRAEEAPSPAAAPQPAPSAETAPFPASWAEFAAQQREEIDAHALSMLAGATALEWNAASVALELAPGPAMAAFLLDKIRDNLSSLFRNAYGLRPAIVLSQKEDLRQNQDYLAERLEEIKKTPEAQALMAALPGDFICFRPGASAVIEEEEADDSDGPASEDLEN